MVTDSVTLSRSSLSVSMNAQDRDFLATVTNWIRGNSSIESAALFGSSATNRQDLLLRSDAADLDLHIIARNAADLESVDWRKELATSSYCFQSIRPATGGVRKVTAVFEVGRIDLVVVPLPYARVARGLIWLGLQEKFLPTRNALNEMATCLQTGFRFLKGEKRWAPFYADVATKLRGVRLSDQQAIQLADAFVVDYLWVLQKIDAGELIAAQHALHRHLSDTNLRLVREFRLRENLALPSFGLGRKLEALISSSELSWLTIDAKLDPKDLRIAVKASLQGLISLMDRIMPGWKIPAQIHTLAPKNAGLATPAR